MRQEIANAAGSRYIGANEEIESQFFPGSVEDHHAALFLLPPSQVAQAKRDQVIKSGWTCFGEGTLPHTPLSDFAQTTLLSNWSPGSGPIDFPKGTGFIIPAGSMLHQIQFPAIPNL